MFDGLTPTEENFAGKLIKGSMALANHSLGKFLNSPMLVQNLDYATFDSKTYDFTDGKKGKLILVETKLVGDIQGANCLIMSENEANTLIENVLGKSEKSSIMTEGLLSETSNILVSSFITEIADTLDLELYPGVPEIIHLDDSNLSEFITSQYSSQMIFIHAELKDKNKDFSPGFTWVIHEKFLGSIKNEAIAS